ncbi:hypothetical protein CRUP_033499 [Coryphaenoides rupestris]|nr:hypothetical protein CRUP_033499 [Coryphaenoides rupestris]
MRVLFFDHLEQRFHDVLSSSLAMVASRKQALGVERERRLQLHQRRPQRIEMDIHNLRSAELHVHAECVSSHCAAVLRVLDSCRSDMSDLRTSTSDSNLCFVASVSAMEELFHTAATSHTLEGFSSTLQDRLGQHIQETQHSQRAFRRSVQQQLEQLRASNTKLVASFRYNVHHVREAVERLEEKLAALLVEARFSEKIQKVLANVQVQIKAEAAHSNQQKVLISSQLEELRRLTETAEVSQEKVLTCLSSLGEGLKIRDKYLDCAVGSFAVAARPRSKPSRRLSRPTGDLPLAAAGVGGASSGGITMDVAKDLNK